jgi:CRP/FNR family transcriptional regulator, anaerobic regulatory protein
VVKIREIGRRELLLKAGQVDREIYFIRKGLLRCYYLKDEKEVSSWFMKEGDTIVSIESFYDQVESYENIQALEDSELYYIRFEELEEIYHQFPDFNFIGRELTVKYLKLWAQQLYGIRMLSAEERYLYLREKQPEILLRVPSKYLASYLDINEITLSKIRGKR